MNLLLRAAELPRSSTLLWNIVPWYIGDGKKIRRATSKDVSEAMPYLGKLISLLSNLKAIVLVGKPAGSTAESIKLLTTVPIFFASHPTQKVLNIYPQKHVEAQNVFKSLVRYL